MFSWSKNNFALKKLKKPPQKVAYLWQSGVFFLSAAPSAQNSPELHFRFIDSPIKSCVLKSVEKMHVSKLAMVILGLGSTI